MCMYCCRHTRVTCVPRARSSIVVDPGGSTYFTWLAAYVRFQDRASYSWKQTSSPNNLFSSPRLLRCVVVIHVTCDQISGCLLAVHRNTDTYASLRKVPENSGSIGPRERHTCVADLGRAAGFCPAFQPGAYPVTDDRRLTIAAGQLAVDGEDVQEQQFLFRLKYRFTQIYILKHLIFLNGGNNTILTVLYL
jgi:hypothetical protein